MKNAIFKKIAFFVMGYKIIPVFDIYSLTV